jgi:hypothetical protein
MRRAAPDAISVLRPGNLTGVQGVAAEPVTQLIRSTPVATSTEAPAPSPAP